MVCLQATEIVQAVLQTGVTGEWVQGVQNWSVETRDQCPKGDNMPVNGSPDSLKGFPQGSKNAPQFPLGIPDTETSAESFMKPTTGRHQSGQLTFQSRNS